MVLKYSYKEHIYIWNIAISRLVRGFSFSSLNQMLLNKIMKIFCSSFSNESAKVRGEELLSPKKQTADKLRDLAFLKALNHFQQHSICVTFTSWGTVSHGFTAKSFKKLRWQSNTSKREPNVRALHGVWKVNRKRCAVKRVQDKKKKLGGSEKNIECESEISTYFCCFSTYFTFLYLVSALVSSHTLHPNTDTKAKASIIRYFSSQEVKQPHTIT